MDTEVFKLIKRVEKDGIAFVKPSNLHSGLAQKTGFIVYKNRRIKRTVIINEKKLKELLGNHFL